jgi:hypothetical protein
LSVKPPNYWLYWKQLQPKKKVLLRDKWLIHL